MLAFIWFNYTTELLESSETDEIICNSPLSFVPRQVQLIGIRYHIQQQLARISSTGNRMKSGPFQTSSTRSVKGFEKSFYRPGSLPRSIKLLGNIATPPGWDACSS